MDRPSVQALPTGTVTLLFTDMQGSTALLSRIGDAYGEVLAQHDELLRAAWAHHGGVVIATAGDGFQIAFGSASDAVAAATEAQHRLDTHAWAHGEPVRVRMGVHTGQPRQRGGEYWGIDVHYAARLCDAAHGGQVLLSASTRARVTDAEVEDMGEHALKDFPAPRRIFHLLLDGRRGADFPPLRTLAVTHSNLPSVATSLVGRERELARLRELLRAPSERLITVVGLGGAGKTRLAVACAAQSLDAFPDGVTLVSLAPVAQPDAVAGAIAEALAAPRRSELGPQAAVIEHLRARRALLVIDNMEHLLDGAGALAEILDAAPHVRLLVTSQAPLRLSGERVLILDALAVPEAGADTLAELTASPAAQLFVERATAADPGFALTDANAASVAQLCRRLDGLPLALELAAARTRVGGVEAVLGGLGQGLDALGRGGRDRPARQQGLRAALQWTIALLTEEQRALYAGLGAFAGAWTIEQAETLCADELDTWEALSGLIDFSLIATRGDGRLTMAERVRAHARELLAASGREHEWRRRHAELMIGWLESLDIEMIVDVPGSAARVREQFGELEYARTWCRTAAPALHRRLVAASGMAYFFAGGLTRLGAEIEALLATDERSDVTSGRLLITHAMVRSVGDDLTEPARWTSEALDVHRRTATPRELLTTLAIHAWMCNLAGRGGESRACVAEALALAARVRADPRLADHLEGTLAMAALAEGAFDEAEVRIQEVLSRPERTDFAAVGALIGATNAALGRGDYEAALQRGVTALREIRGRDTYNALMEMQAIIAALAGLGRDREAAQLSGACDQAYRELGMAQRPRGSWPNVHKLAAAAKARMGPEAWAQHEARGRRLDFEGALNWAQARVIEPAAR